MKIGPNWAKNTKLFFYYYFISVISIRFLLVMIFIQIGQFQEIVKLGAILGPNFGAKFAKKRNFGFFKL